MTCLPAALLLLTLVGGCGLGTQGPIVVFCSSDSARVQQAVQGLQKALGPVPLEVVCVPEFGEQGQVELRRLRHRRPRLLVVFGTPALMWAAPVEKRIPLVFALVANPYFTGAAYNPNDPGDHQGNLTGIASPPPLRAALEQGIPLLGTGTWGMLYDPNDGVAVELKERFLAEAPSLGVWPLTQVSTDAADDRRGLESLLARRARVIYLPPAPSASRYAELLLTWGREGKVLVVSSLPEAHKGAVLSVALDYERLGEEAGRLVQRVLQGENPARMPIVESMPLKIEVDETLVRRWSGYPSTLNFEP
jgi:putative ABC transport system substrate-binding protein